MCSNGPTSAEHQHCTQKKKKPDMACAAGLYKAFDRFPKELVSVIIGEGNHVGEAGALAMASRCEGVKQLLHSCPLLEDISIGGHHHRRAFSDGDILTECSTIEVLDAGGRRLDQDGEVLISALSMLFLLCAFVCILFSVSNPS
jgi:hypothetical protein